MGRSGFDCQDRLAQFRPIDPTEHTAIIRQDQASPAFELLDWTVERLSTKGISNPDGLFCLRCLPLRPPLCAQRIGATQYPVVPGHERFSRLTAIGNALTRYHCGTWSPSAPWRSHSGCG